MGVILAPWEAAGSTEALWKPHPGAQLELLHRDEREILFAGEKGGGKSSGAVGWLVKGNPLRIRALRAKKQQPDPIDFSYLNYPKFRGIFIRKNYQDMQNWVDQEASPVYGTRGDKMGATLSKNPWEFVWPNGAKIVMGHLAETDSYQRYFGGLIHRIVIDEASFLLDPEIFDQIRSCPRSSHPLIFPQVMWMCNPIGPSMGYFRDRFVDIRDRDGKPIPPLTTIAEAVYNRVTKQTEMVKRVWIPSKLSENLTMNAADSSYAANLEATEDEAKRKAYFGDWHAWQGAYFGSFRPDGPLAGDPSNARHIYPALELSALVKPWYPLVLGMDWGFSHHAAVGKARLTPDGLCLLVDEMASTNITASEWGSRIALWCIPEFKSGLRGGVLWLSPEQFGGKHEFRPRSLQIMDGIRSVLGADSAIVLDPDVPLDKMRALQSESFISIRPAYNQRVAGWQFLREMLRWRSHLPPTPPTISQEEAIKVFSEQGVEKYAQWLRARQGPSELLPKLRISDKCRMVRRALESAVYNQLKTGDPEDVHKLDVIDDDVRDMLRYLIMGVRQVTEVEPKDHFVERRVQEILAQGGNPDSLYDIARRQEEVYEEQHAELGAFSISRTRGISRPEGWLQ